LSPRGEEFEVLGRAGPLRFRRAPYVRAEAREDLLVIKQEGVFLCARTNGDIQPTRISGEGLYADDTRFLSECRLLLGGRPPVALSFAGEGSYHAVVEATNATILADGDVAIPQQQISVQRLLVIADRLYHEVRLRSFFSRPAATTLELSLGADFADMFEVRGGQLRQTRGHALAPKRTESGLVLAYVGEDEVFRETVIEFDPAPELVEINGDRAAARWTVTLRPGAAASLLATIEPASRGRRRRRRRLSTAIARLDEAERAREESCTAITTDNELVDKLLSRSRRDLWALLMPAPRGEILAAGIPWYVAPFGRDSLVAAQEALMLDPTLARATLLVLAGLQADRDDAWRDAEPGKILHELRSGELASAGIIPHTPYYGTVDATPLFLMLAAAYYRWTLNVELLTALRPALDAALSWIDDHGDRDGDGFVEYERRSPAGLRNQGWKDSEDSVVHADGSVAEGPIALAEVQGYVYRAKVRIAEVYEALGAGAVADELRTQAEALRVAFNEVFWDSEEGTYALALDGRKRQVRSVTSNAGHCLYCEIADPDKAAAVAERLMAPDMFCGWGVRTLSSASPAYNPMSYHNGSVWPHDNAIIAAGLKRYGFSQAAARIAGALFDVGTAARDFRLPELYCGFDREPAGSVVAYPVACIPQAWAAAAPFMLLQAMLGISARAPDGALAISKPVLPDWLSRVELRRLRVGEAVVSLAFERDGGVAGFSLLEQEGPIRVTMTV
jgi:glycogen debranching enzyme